MSLNLHYRIHKILLLFCGYLRCECYTMVVINTALLYIFSSFRSNTKKKLKQTKKTSLTHCQYMCEEEDWFEVLWTYHTAREWQQHMRITDIYQSVALYENSRQPNARTNQVYACKQRQQYWNIYRTVNCQKAYGTQFSIARIRSK